MDRRKFLRQAGVAGAGVAAASTLAAPAIAQSRKEMVIVSTWPRGFTAERAKALGFKAESSFDEIIRIHIEDEMGGAL